MCDDSGDGRVEGTATTRPAIGPIMDRRGATDSPPAGGRRAALVGFFLRSEPIIRRVALCVVLYSLPLIALCQPVLDPDIWWHIRTGRWVVENHRVPATDPFSSFGSGRHWVAYSWLFEVLVSGCHRLFGLVGIWVLRAIPVYAVAVALHGFIARREPRFVRVAGLLAVGFLGLLPLGTERPWHFTILFSIPTLAAIEAVRMGRRPWWLWTLPPVFALWANLHVQFVYGLGLLGLAVIGESADAYVLGDRSLSRRPNDPRILLILLIACVLATGINPYGFAVYRPVLEYCGHSSVFDEIQEHRAPDFRSISDWCLVGLAGAAAFAMGRRRSRPTYLLALLVTTTYLGFHSGRDRWILVAADLLILTSEAPAWCPDSERFRYTRSRLLATSLCVGSALGIVAWWNGISPTALREAVERKYPERAAAFLERSEPAGPIYNHFDWGGYLIWRLPDYPVVIDGRTNLHGDARIDRSLKIWDGQSDRWADPEFQKARIIIADRKMALAPILSLDPHFDRIYEDSVAVVFRRRGEGKTVAMASRARGR